MALSCCKFPLCGTNKGILILILILEVVTCYKYLGIWLDDCLTIKLHVNNLLKKLRVRLGFFFRNKSCFSFEVRKRLGPVTYLPVLDYGDLLYMNAPAYCLNKLDPANHNALRFVTNCKALNHCTLYARGAQYVDRGGNAGRSRVIHKK